MKHLAFLLLATLVTNLTWSAFADESPAPASAAEEPAAESSTPGELPGELPGEPADEPLKPRLPLNELRVFVEVFNRISTAYVEEIDDRTLLENAIKGMLSQLDPHSAYLDKDSFADLQEATTGNYGGLGIEIVMASGLLAL